MGQIKCALGLKAHFKSLAYNEGNHEHYSYYPHYRADFTGTAGEDLKQTVACKAETEAVGN